MKRLLCVVLSLGFFVATAFCVPFVASAQEYKGTQIKNSTTYYYYDAADKTLYINGNGDIPNLSNSTASIPWLEWESGKIQRVVVSEGITSLGDYVFYGVQDEQKRIELEKKLTYKKYGLQNIAFDNKQKELWLEFGCSAL